MKIILLLSLLSVLKIQALKIEIQNKEKYLNRNWKVVKEETHKANKSKTSKEKLFLLLEVEYNSENHYSVMEYESNNITYTSCPVIEGEYKEFNFYIDFSEANPKYKITFGNVKIKEINNGISIETKVLKANQVDLNEEAKKLLKKEINKDNKEDYNDRVKQSQKIITDLISGNYKEVNNKWALFEIETKGDDFKKYFYCNDIESNNNDGIFMGKEITSLEVIKSNTTDVENLSWFCRNCSDLINVDITNLITNHKMDLCGMFENCNNLKSVTLPSDENKLKTDSINNMFTDCKNLENVNFEDLDLTNTKKLTRCFTNCHKLKKVKFPKIKITKDTEVSYKGKNGKTCGILADCDIEELDISQVTFEKNTGTNMFARYFARNITFPENMKDLSEQQLRNIFNNIRDLGGRCKIGQHELEYSGCYDDIVMFIKNTEYYIKTIHKARKDMYMNTFGKRQFNKGLNGNGCCKCCEECCRSYK